MFGVLALALGTQAQPNRNSNYIGLNLGGGLNTLLYNPADGTWKPQLGALAELKYMHFFGKHFGMGFGAQFNYTRAAATFNNTKTVNGLVHPANPSAGTYNATTGFFDWRETQTSMLLSVPVEFYWRAPMGERWFFLLGLGAQFDLPLKSEYNADEGSYNVQGYFPATGVTYNDPANGYPPLPAYGFDRYEANHKDDIKDLKQFGISLIADLGFNYSLSNHWGLYFGIYGGYGLTNLIDEPSQNEKLVTPNTSSSVTDNTYYGVINSNQVDELHLLNAGVKIGINLGWRCHGGSDYGDAVSPLAATAAAGAAAAAAAFGNDTDEDEQAAIAAEEEAARIARCNARRMNDPDLKSALESIDNDLADADRAVNANGDKKSQTKLSRARTKAADAKAAYQKGNYCEAYDLFRDAYAAIADAYAANAAICAAKNRNNVSNKAAEDAALYADAAHNDGLDCAMASSRNARINAGIACDNSDRGVYNRSINPDAVKNVQSLLDQINAIVNFEFNMTEPIYDASSDLAITTLCKAMAEDRNIRVTLIGHTDNIGSNESNLDLGQRRADALKELMVKRGAPAANIRTETRGEEEPMVDNDTPEHRYQNRRAVIVLK
jgi:outer membrane protein OmpA-like peptidoglycan-associated protein